MLKVGEDELICDLAETYNILNYKGLSPQLVAVLSCGLSEDSRIKRKISGVKLTFEQMLEVMIFDSLILLVWSKTKDAQKNRNRPKSLFKKLLNNDKKDDLASFETPEEYEAYMKKIRGF